MNEKQMPHNARLSFPSVSDVSHLAHEKWITTILTCSQRQIDQQIQANTLIQMDTSDLVAIVPESSPCHPLDITHYPSCAFSKAVLKACHLLRCKFWTNTMMQEG